MYYGDIVSAFHRDASYPKIFLRAENIKFTYADSDNGVHEGMMGFVPQDDLLIEELSVYQNLYYNARLCLGELDEAEINKRIDKILNSLGLFYVKDLVVGSPLQDFHLLIRKTCSPF